MNRLFRQRHFSIDISGNFHRWRNRQPSKRQQIFSRQHNNGFTVNADDAMSWSQLCSTHSYEVKDLSDFTFSSVEFNDGSHLDFSGFNLRGADFSNIKYKTQQLLRGVLFWDKGIFIDADMRDVILKKHFTTNNLHSSVYNHIVPRIFFCKITANNGFTFEQFKTVRNYKDGDLRHFYFSGCNLSDWDFSGMNLTESIFNGSMEHDLNLSNVIFEDAVITNILMGNRISGLTIEQIKSTWNYKHGHMSGIQLPPEIQNALEQEKHD